MQKSLNILLKLTVDVAQPLDFSVPPAVDHRQHYLFKYGACHGIDCPHIETVDVLGHDPLDH